MGLSFRDTSVKKTKQKKHDADRHTKIWKGPPDVTSAVPLKGILKPL